MSTDRARLLELLALPRKWATIRLAGFEWRDEALSRDAFRRATPPESVPLVATGRARPGREERPTGIPRQPWRFSMDERGRIRTEFVVGDETVTAVIDGTRWWSWSAGQGARMYSGDRSYTHGLGPAEALIETARILPVIELAEADRTRLVGREALRAVGRPLESDDFEHARALHGLGLGADEYELVVDAVTGVMLRIESRVDGARFRVVEVEEFTNDEPIDPTTFELQPPDGSAFVDAETVWPARRRRRRRFFERRWS